MSWEWVIRVWSMIFALDTARYFIGVGIVAWVLYRVLRRFSDSRRIQARRPSARDYRREILYSISTAAVYASVGVATIATYHSGLVDQPWRPQRLGWTWAVAALGPLLVLHDAYFYWAHRAMHHPWLFRHFHGVHHRSHTPSSWAAYSFAPGEAFVMAAFLPIATYAFPVPQSTLFVFMAIMIVRNAMGHSGIEFHPRWWIDSPLDLVTTTTYHDLHHQRVHGNYGLYFTWWDRWMGTEIADYRAEFRRASSGGGDAGDAESAGSASRAA